MAMNMYFWYSYNIGIEIMEVKWNYSLFLPYVLQSYIYHVKHCVIAFDGNRYVFSHLIICWVIIRMIVMWGQLNLVIIFVTLQQNNCLISVFSVYVNESTSGCLYMVKAKDSFDHFFRSAWLKWYLELEWIKWISDDK